MSLKNILYWKPINWKIKWNIILLAGQGALCNKTTLEQYLLSINVREEQPGS